jgi:5-methylcytosine-specific restriction endonuclease McrA
MSKACTKCGECKPLTEFNTCSKTKCGYRAKCRKCTRAYNRKYLARNRDKRREYAKKYIEANKERRAERLRKWRQNNREKDREIQRAYRATPMGIAVVAANNHNRQAEKRGCIGRITAQQVLWLYEYYGYKCVDCGNVDDLQLDHVKPLARKGMNLPANLQVVCRECNLERWKYY